MGQKVCITEMTNEIDWYLRQQQNPESDYSCYLNKPKSGKFNTMFLSRSAFFSNKTKYAF